MRLNPLTLIARMLFGSIENGARDAVIRGIVNATVDIEAARAADGVLDLEALKSKYPHLVASGDAPAIADAETEPDKAKRGRK